jgi:hypothetical protein
MVGCWPSFATLAYARQYLLRTRIRRFRQKRELIASMPCTDVDRERECKRSISAVRHSARVPTWCLLLVDFLETIQIK